MLKLRQIVFGASQTEIAVRKSLPLFGLIAGAIVFWELLLRALLVAQLSWNVLSIVAFSLFFGLAAAILAGLLPRGGNIAVLWICLSVLYLWYAIQLIYYQIFGGFLSVYLVKMGGDAVTSFFKETVGCVKQNVGLLLFMALPLPVTGFLLHKKWVNVDRRPWGCSVRQVLYCVLLHVLCVSCLSLGGKAPYSVYDAYHNVNTGTDASVSKLGFLTTFRLELKYILLGNDKGPSVNVDDLVVVPPSDLSAILGGGSATKPSTPNSGNQNATTPSGGTDASQPDAPTIPEIPVVTVRDQVLEIDFDALIAQAQQEGDSTLTTLHQYFATQLPTKTNEYTGLFAGKNLIYLVCESFSPEVISKELTPTLYKLYYEGIRFTNFYCSYKNTTTNGEYSACLGIFPDLSRSKSDGSFLASKNNYLPFALGNMFKSQLGIDSYGYHNFLGSYYGRNQTHPNMGYSCKFMNAGMNFSHSWPSSDYEMMVQSVQDYIYQDQFHAYYMTFSGHYAYNFTENPMCVLHQEDVAHLDYSEAVRAYIACHLELEKAMAYLMEQLELAGQLENTVIVMTADHYPYGLNSKQYNELAGESIDTSFGIYQNAFICWAYGMEDPIVVDTPCCTVDILPTLLNLFGFSYDSRLLIGQDVLDPSALHIATLYNGSFITDKVKFNSSNGKITYLVDPSEVQEGYVEILTQIVQNRFTVSTAILDYDYYRIVFDPQ